MYSQGAHSPNSPPREVAVAYLLRSGVHVPVAAAGALRTASAGAVHPTLLLCVLRQLAAAEANGARVYSKAVRQDGAGSPLFLNVAEDYVRSRVKGVLGAEPLIVQQGGASV